MNTYTQELSDFIFTSKYARFDEIKKRRETWEESVDRLLDMHLRRFSWLENSDIDEVIAAFDAVKEKKNVPSMRSLQFGGKAVEAHNARLFNCLAEHTQFITKEGIRTFEDFSSGEYTTVLTHKGQWKRAKVVNYGKDYLYPITISRCKNETIIYATKDHRWISQEGNFIEGVERGQHLRGAEDIFSKFSYETASPFEKLYWCYGYVFGDGSIVSSGENKYSMVRLCKQESKYNIRFEEMGFSTSQPLSCEGDFFAYTGKYLKTTPNPKIDSSELVRAFVAGYCDADASKHRNSNRNYETSNVYSSIQATGDTHVEFIRECFPIAGIYIVSEEDLTGQSTNFGPRKDLTVKFRIFNAPNNKINSNTPFIVSNIGEPIFGETWCLEVEDDQSFTLPNGLVTGNCAVRHVDSIRSFSEIFYLLLCGCGVGIGLQDKYLRRLPNLVTAEDKTGTVLTYVIEDTIEGWADSIEALLSCYFKNTAWTGRKIVFDYSRIRKKGTILKTGGGKAPGYRGLKKAHGKIKAILDFIIEEMGQTSLASINAYDILMHQADAVLSGGIRRSACSLIFLEDDEDLLNSKTFFKVLKKGKFEFNEKTEKYEGYVIIDDPCYKNLKIDVEVPIQYGEYDSLMNNNVISWIRVYPQRARSNNSVLLLRDKITFDKFVKIFDRTRQFGEPGFVFANNEDTLFNPCFEISFIPVYEGTCGVQFCNLSSINGAAIKTKFDLFAAAKHAAIIGTLQASYTDFPYLSKVSKWLTEEEALLGVSITGMMDNPEVNLDPEIQKAAAEIVKETNKIWAEKLYINPAARTTCIKPEGTSSLVLQSASGIHPHHARRYFRRVQCNKIDPVYLHFKKNNPHMCEESVWSANKTDDVVTFPIEVSENAIIKENLTALEHLDIIRSTQQNWVQSGKSVFNKKDIDNNVSCTVIVDVPEWDKVIEYLFENKNYFAAVSFIGKSGDKDYAQAPLENITTEEDDAKWNTIIKDFFKVDYTTLKETTDQTALQAELVCAGNQCENPILSN